MTDLAAQIIAALDRAEETAQAATPGPWDLHQTIHAEAQIRRALDAPPDHNRCGFGIVAVPSYGAIDYGLSNAAHIAANDPAHVLRLTTALRKVVELHALSTQDVYDADGIERPGRDCVECWDTYPCRTLHLLASVWDVPGDNT